ncbi:OpgC family protein [Falsiroseomonas sp. HW251]|uniref:OpgC family protein n=1 Tax=Falsiroseomonas sp. HW251 TaxID=3390998 RepID=UPI003D31FC68
MPDNQAARQGTIETTPPAPGAAPRGRDLRADVCRGLALWMIMINHMPGNGLTVLTLRHFALADAAEAFVLLAGYAAAFAFAGPADRKGMPFAAAAVLRRIGVLYVAHIFLLVLFTAQVGASARALDRAFYIDELALDPLGEDPYSTLTQALMLRFQPHFLDILPLYIVLLALLIPALAIRRYGWALLGVSVAVWLFARWADVNFLLLSGEGWQFNPLAWQLLFFCGFLIGQAVRGQPGPGLPPRKAWLTGLAVLVVAAGVAWQLSWQFRPDWGEELSGLLAALLVQVDKTSLHPARLATILALAYLVGHYLPRDWPPLRGPLLRPFLQMGQHSLPVFCGGILVSFLGRLALEAEDGPLSLAAVNILAFLLLAGIAAVAAWYDRQERGTPGLPRAAEVR